MESPVPGLTGESYIKVTRFTIYAKSHLRQGAVFRWSGAVGSFMTPLAVRVTIPQRNSQSDQGGRAMPARTGAEYIANLKENGPEVYLHGERVKDVTTHPALRGGVETLARLYDMQHDPAIRDEMTYVSPTTGDRVGTSFIMPRTKEDLDARRVMMRHWARATFGMMGRSPDFMNVNIMAMAAAGDYFAQNRPEFKDNINSYYEHVRENDLVLTHTLLNLQRSRTPGTTPLEDRTDIALRVEKETDAGIYVHGARVLATLAPLSEEIALYPTTSHQLPGQAPEPYAFAFAVANNTPGLRYQCRESFDFGGSNFDHPLGSRFEEMDAVAFFDHVFVPWEQVFLLGDVELCNNLQQATNRHLHSGHQVVTKNVAKCEFVLGLATLMTETLGSSSQQQVQQMIAEIVENLEVTKACLRAAEADAEVDQWGIMAPERVAPAGRPQPVHPHVPAHGGDHPPAGFQQPDGPSHGGRPRGTTGRGDQPLPGNRRHLGPRPRAAVPAGVGHVVQRLRGQADPLRTVLPGRLGAQCSDPVQHERPGTPRRLGAAVPGTGVRKPDAKFAGGAEKQKWKTLGALR